MPEIIMEKGKPDHTAAYTVTFPVFKDQICDRCGEIRDCAQTGEDDFICLVCLDPTDA
jgi:formylmethanofuran dehydrogenase subunit E